MRFMKGSHIMPVTNENEHLIHQILMPYATASRITPHTLQSRISSVATTAITLSFLVESGYVIFHEHNDRCTGVQIFMDDGYYTLTSKAKELLK